jgi:hypothetical protein
VLGKTTWSPLVMRPSFRALVRSVCPNSEGTQLVDELVVLLFPHLVLVGKGLYAYLQQRRQGGSEGAQKRKEDAAMVAVEGQ